jgi:hypothetical protein
LEKLFAPEDHGRMGLIEHHQGVLSSAEIAFQGRYDCIRTIQHKGLLWLVHESSLHKPGLADF